MNVQGETAGELWKNYEVARSERLSAFHLSLTHSVVDGWRGCLARFRLDAVPNGARGFLSFS